MADTLYAQLLERLQEYENDATGLGPILTLTGALRAVISSHVSVERYCEPDRPGCGGCDWGDYADGPPDWPCSTIRVVADALGVTDQELIEKGGQA